MIHVLAVGDDLPEDVPTVVFLHGLFGQGRNFTTIAKGLLPQARSLLVDLPDHGRSDWTERVDLVGMADTVAAAVRVRVGTSRRIALVGHSLGGKVAMLLALRHPDLVERLAVVDIAPARSHDVSEFAQLLDALATVDLARVESRGDADAALLELIPNRTVRSFLLQNLHRDDTGWRWRSNLELLRTSLDVIGDFPELAPAAFDRPVLWVAGDRSDYVDPEHDGEAMRALFPRTVHVSVKNAGHWVHSEQPEAFTQILRRFVLEPARTPVRGEG